MPNPYVILRGEPSQNPSQERIVNQDLFVKDPVDPPDMWPIHSVFFTDEEETNPNTLLGFGTWESLGKIPSVDAWGWKRIA